MVFLAYASTRTTRLLLQLEPRDGVRLPPHVSTFQRESLASASASVSQTTPPPSPPSTPARLSPAVLFIIVILAVIFFASGLLHLLVRFLIRKSPVSASASSNRSGGQYTAGDEAGPDALQRQLQQLFHLHDMGLDQAFIDALPVFLYREIVGPKEPFDCAVCLCEFAATDPLRLLPACGHAFHLACIDTWLLSNSTCPLCRGALFIPSLAVESPIFNFEEYREEDGLPGDCCDGFASLPGGRKPGEAEEIVEEKNIFPVRLGKFTQLSNGDDGNNVDCMGGEITNVRAEQGETSSSNLDARRCYSMGSYQYVVGDANLCVELSSGSMRFSDVKNGRVRGLNGNLTADGGDEGKRLGIGSRGESFSVSKIWLWSSKKGKYPVSSDASSLDGGLPWLQTSMGDA